jgi:hypothetical protein
MDGRRIDAVTDESLDRELESLLAVEPSPEFLARVRTRVAEEPEPGGWRLPWMLGAAGAAVAIAVAVMVWPSADVNPSSAPSFEAPQVAEAVEPAAPAATSAGRILTRQAARGVAGLPVRTIDIDLPEVVVGENEAEAYAALVASVRQRRFDATVPVAPNPDVPLEIKELPPVEPLEIEPIVRVAALQTEGEHP